MPPGPEADILALSAADSDGSESDGADLALSSSMRGEERAGTIDLVFGFARGDGVLEAEAFGKFMPSLSSPEVFGYFNPTFSVV